MKKEILTGVELPPENFSPNYRKPPKNYSKLSEEERRIRRKETQAKQYAKRTKEYNKFYNDKQRARTDEIRKASLVKAKANNIAKWNAKLEAQAGRPRPLNCEICNDEGKICFDHCHKNNHFRGWICDKCNRLLGISRDDPELLAKLITYLQNDMLKNSDKY